MDIRLDFQQPSNGPPPDAASFLQAEQLLGCYRRALGHELPNRMVALQGLARLLADDPAPALDDDARNSLKRLAEIARQTDVLVRTLARLGRLGRAVETALPVVLTELVAEVVAGANYLGGRTTVRYHEFEEVGAVLVPRSALAEVLQQLVRNATALRATRPDVEVVVGARRVDEGVEISVSDDGGGLPEVDPDRLFDPFGRDASRPGFGLFIVRLLVAAWRGRLQIASEVGRGATVTVLIRQARAGA